jgi:hypothetical protein
VGTGVYLKPIKDSGPPIEVLGFEFHSAYASQTAVVDMKWISPSHLEVGYNGQNAILNFQAVKYDGIEISVRDLSKETSGISRRENKPE